VAYGLSPVSLSPEVPVLAVL